MLASRGAALLLGALVLSGCGGAAAPSSPSAASTAPSAAAAKPSAAASPSTAAKPSAAAAASSASAGTAASAKPAAKPAASAQAGAAGNLKPMKLSVPTKGSAFAYVYAAKDLGFFEKHGIDAQIAVVSPSNAVAAMQSGDLDFATTVGSTIRAALRGAPVRVVMVGSNRPDFVVLGAKGLTSIDQLKGKVIGVDAPQTTTFVLLTELLKRKGMQPGQYQTLTATTDQSRAALMSSGQAQACIVELSTATLLEKQGYPVLANVADFPEEPFVGLGAGQGSLQKKRDALRDGLQAVLEGVEAMRTQKDKVLPVMTKEFDLSPQDAGSIYDVLQSSWTTDGRPSQAATEFELSNDQQAMELKEKPRPDQVYDFSLLDELSKK